MEINEKLLFLNLPLATKENRMSNSPDKRHKTSPFEWSWSNPLFGYKMMMVKLDQNNHDPRQPPIHQIRLVKTKQIGRKNSENLRDYYIMKWIENHKLIKSKNWLRKWQIMSIPSLNQIECSVFFNSTCQQPVDSVQAYLILFK